MERCSALGFVPPHVPWRSDALFEAALREHLRNRAKMYEIILEMTMYGIMFTAVQLMYEIIMPAQGWCFFAAAVFRGGPLRPQLASRALRSLPLDRRGPRDATSPSYVFIFTVATAFPLSQVRFWRLGPVRKRGVYGCISWAYLQTAHILWNCRLYGPLG